MLSYLLSQPEVDASRIGAKGYSYGGTIMWNLAMDERVKAVVAYFGIGWNEYFRSKHVWLYNNPYQAPAMSSGEQLYLSAIAPQAHAPHVRAASLWLNGSNDHHGGHERGAATFKQFSEGVPWDFAIQARGHHNTEKLGNGCKLWLEKHVLDSDQFWPERPQTGISLNRDGVPEFWIRPANTEQMETLSVYYAQRAGQLCPCLARYRGGAQGRLVGGSLAGPQCRRLCTVLPRSATPVISWCPLISRR